MLGAHGSQKTVTQPLGLERQTVGSFHVSAGRAASALGLGATSPAPCRFETGSHCSPEQTGLPVFSRLTSDFGQSPCLHPSGAWVIDLSRHACQDSLHSTLQVSRQGRGWFSPPFMVPLTPDVAINGSGLGMSQLCSSESRMAPPVLREGVVRASPLHPLTRQDSCPCPCG